MILLKIAMLTINAPSYLPVAPSTSHVENLWTPPSDGVRRDTWGSQTGKLRQMPGPRLQSGLAGPLVGGMLWDFHQK